MARPAVFLLQCTKLNPVFSSPVAANKANINQTRFLAITTSITLPAGRVKTKEPHIQAGRQLASTVLLLFLGRYHD